jgi:hypothetical protein
MHDRQLKTAVAPLNYAEFPPERLPMRLLTTLIYSIGIATLLCTIPLAADGFSKSGPKTQASSLNAKLIKKRSFHKRKLKKRSKLHAKKIRPHKKYTAKHGRKGRHRKAA